MSNAHILQEVRYPAAYRLLIAALGLFCLFMAFVAWMAYSEEGTQTALYLVPIFVAAAIYVLFALAASPQIVVFERDRLTVRRWLGTRTVLYERITAVNRSRGFTTIVTRDGTLRLQKLHANLDAILYGAFEQHVPVIKSAQAVRLNQDLPIVVNSKRLAPTLTALLGLMLLFAAGGLVQFAVTNGTTFNLGNWFILLLLFPASGGLGLFLLFQFLWRFAWRFTFGRDRIKLHYLLHSEQYPTNDIVAITTGQEIWTTRGVRRTVYYIEVQFDAGRPLKLILNRFSFPLDYIDAEEAQLVTELAGQLQRAYQLPSTTAVAEQVHSMLAEIRTMTSHDYMYAYETLRDEFNALGRAALPHVLAAACENEDHFMIDLLVMVLADVGYRPAMPAMVKWLNHSNEEVRYIAAMTLDALANGRFKVAEMVAGGWVQHDQIEGMIPQIQDWWETEGALL